VLALPAIRNDLNASSDGLQGMQFAFLWPLAATVVTAGRLGDIRGRQRGFLAGMAAFAVGSIVGGAATSDEMLVAARVIQGIGGAALLSLSLALTSHAFPGDQQARALGIWAAVSAIALAVGPLAGGVLIEAASWRWIFFINVPVCAAGIAILLARGAESRAPDAAPRGDVTGAAVLAVGLTAVVLALVQVDEWGWGSARTWALLGGGAAVLYGFWRLEHRRTNPLVDFSLFRNGPYLGATAAAFALVGSYWTVMFFEPQFLQQQLGYGAVEAGAMVLPITVPMAIFSSFSGRLIARLGVRLTMTIGMLVGLTGVALIALAQDADSYGALLPGYLLFGVSLALVYAPMSTAAMAAMPAEKAGIASGVLAMNRVLAGAVVLAAAGAVFQSKLPSGYTDAVAAAVIPAVAILVPGAILTWLLVRAPATPTTPPPDELQHHQHHRRFHL
jgi:EmrB/QacA subfamily drug resistance transporter